MVMMSRLRLLSVRLFFKYSTVTQECERKNRVGKQTKRNLGVLGHGQKKPWGGVSACPIARAVTVI